ncbi:MAG: aminotransferase class V-fold PLP-dependent enzyme, partial [Alphaproteobacteria bacterium]|nr:aminotransferase class V-fold PLP-dependent enzyme [Alphaproteobacteria bacterium]
MNLRRLFPAFAAQPGLRPLDNAATAQVPDLVLDAMRGYEAQGRGNVGRGQHRLAERADRAYDEARNSAARFLSAAPEEIVFTSGATASINLLARALRLGPGDEIVASVAEHHANLIPWRLSGATLRPLPITPDGRLDLSSLPDILTPRCRLVALTHASNVTGALTDVAQVVGAARAVGAPVLLDGAQVAPHGPRDVRALGVDFYAFSGHKCFGPTGIGVLWGRDLERLPPAWGGGGMVRRVTPDTALWAPPP